MEIEVRCEKCGKLHGKIKKTITGDILFVKGKTKYFSDGVYGYFKCSDKRCNEIFKYLYRKQEEN